MSVISRTEVVESAIRHVDCMIEYANRQIDVCYSEMDDHRTAGRFRLAVSTLDSIVNHQVERQRLIDRRELLASELKIAQELDAAAD